MAMTVRVRSPRFICFFHYLGLWSWQLGFHIYPRAPNIELHVPFGFLKVGWEVVYDREKLKQIRTVGYQDGHWQVIRYDKDEEY